ncbi:MAG: AMP-binding protein, partial [Reyranellales bacterium]
MALSSEEAPHAITRNLQWNAAAHVALDRDGPADIAFRPFDPRWVDRPALDLFAAIVASHPGDVACEDIDTRLTFADLWAAARRLAATIDGAVAAGAPVGVLLPNQASYAAAVLACLGAARPCVLIDRNYPEDRVGRIVRDAGLSAVVLRRADIAGGYLLPTGVRAIELENALEGDATPERMPAAPPPPDAATFVVYTSGSTGAPKGIVLSQKGVLHRAAELVNAVHLRPGDKVLSLASPGTIGGLQQIFEVMLAGATLVKLDLQLLGLGQILRTIAERRITMMFSTPAVWRSVSRLEGAREMLASLRCIQSSGDTLLRVDHDLVRAVLPGDCHVLSVYGATEAPALLQWFVTSPPTGEVRVPAGYPLPDLDFAVLDKHDRPVADGEPGELVIRSRFTSLGLWRRGAVVPGDLQSDPASPGLKIYRTGDLVRQRSDGLYVVLGRRDRQIKILGNRVELAEIETALRQSPGVLDAAAVARRDDGEPLLLGFVVPRQRGDPLVLEVVRRHLDTVLPNYMRPRRLLALDSLPLLPGRKVDEDALLAYAAPGTAPGNEHAMAEADWTPSRRAIELVDKAWRIAMGHAPPGRSISFEQAGGDSLQLLQLIFEIERLAERPPPMERFHGRLSAQHFAVELDGCLGKAAEVLPSDVPAIFLFPPAGGGDAYLTAFRAACVARVLVRQVRYPDLRALVQADASFERVAAHAVGQIEALKPKGSLILAGYSDGGDTAYEAARQLCKKGRHVARFLVLDTDASGLAYPAPAAEPDQGRPRIRRYVRRPTFHHYRRLIEMLVPVRLLRKTRGRAILRLALALRLSLPAGIAFIVSLKAYDVLFDELHRRWSAGPQPQQLDVPVVLFRSEEHRPGAPRDLGWASRT